MKLTQVERKLYKLFIKFLNYDQKSYIYLMSNQFIDLNKCHYYGKLISNFGSWHEDIKYTNNGSLLIMFKHMNYLENNKMLRLPLCLLLDYDEVEYYLSKI